MSLPVLSIVIPTHNRRSKLDRTLSAIEEQKGFDGNFEVIVVDDHSSDNTLAFLERYCVENLRCHALVNPGRGPAAARNAGIAEARAARVLLLGDDTRPDHGTLAAHLQRAEGREIGVQGHIDWDPGLPLTEVMEFLAPAGPQFYFKGLRDGQALPYSAVLGSNVSAPRRWFLEEPFDEGFPAAAFEDTELAFRWQRRGWKTIYAPEAGCWHDHLYAEIESFLARQTRAGQAARYAARLHPTMARKILIEPIFFGFWVALRYALKSREPEQRQRDLWDLKCRWAYLKGWLAKDRRST